KGTDRFFIYRKSDWESWRKKSQQPNGANWNENGQPNAAFLRTKAVKHACKEKCWSIGNSVPVEVETFTGIEIDAEQEDLEEVQAAKTKQEDHYSYYEEVEEEQPNQ